MIAALALTRGDAYTFPILELDGEVISDSTEIIGALERRHPEPPLYPEDPVERRRALDLEDYFDEELGPPLRLLGFHEMVRDPNGSVR
jgi:glutathione S-transferase